MPHGDDTDNGGYDKNHQDDNDSEDHDDDGVLVILEYYDNRDDNHSYNCDVSDNDDGEWMIKRKMW